MKRIALLMVVALLAIGCGLTEPSKVVIISFSADSVSITRGTCTTLRWESQGGDTARIDTNVGIPVGSVEATGNTQVCPLFSTVYSLNVKKGDSTPVIRNLTVLVN